MLTLPLSLATLSKGIEKPAAVNVANNALNDAISERMRRQSFGASTATFPRRRPCKQG